MTRAELIARNGLWQIDVLIRHYFGIDPDGLDDEEWTKRASEALWLDKHQEELLYGALVRFWNAINGR